MIRGGCFSTDRKSRVANCAGFRPILAQLAGVGYEKNPWGLKPGILSVQEMDEFVLPATMRSMTRVWKGLFAFLLVGGSSWAMPPAEDTEALEAAFEQAVEDLNSRDLSRFLASWHPEAVLMARNYPFAVDRSETGDEMWSEIFKDFFATTAKARYEPVDVHFRVIGNTGVVWGQTRLWVEGKDGQTRAQENRLAATFVKLDGRWLILMWNDSDRPPRVGPQPDQ